MLELALPQAATRLLATPPGPRGGLPRGLMVATCQGRPQKGPCFPQDDGDKMQEQMEKPEQLGCFSSAFKKPFKIPKDDKMT